MKNKNQLEKIDKAIDNLIEKKKEILSKKAKALERDISHLFEQHDDINKIEIKAHQDREVYTDIFMKLVIYSNKKSHEKSRWEYGKEIRGRFTELFRLIEEKIGHFFIDLIFDDEYDDKN